MRKKKYDIKMYLSDRSKHSIEYETDISEIEAICARIKSYIILFIGEKRGTKYYISTDTITRFEVEEIQ